MEDGERGQVGPGADETGRTLVGGGVVRHGSAAEPPFEVGTGDGRSRAEKPAVPFPVLFGLVAAAEMQREPALGHGDLPADAAEEDVAVRLRWRQRAVERALAS